MLSTQSLYYNLESSAPSSCTSHSKHLVNTDTRLLRRSHVTGACAGPGMVKPRGWVHGSLACPSLPGTLSSLLLVLTALLSSSQHEDILLVPRSGFLCTPSSADYDWSRKGPGNSIHLKMTAPPLLATLPLSWILHSALQLFHGQEGFNSCVYGSDNDQVPGRGRGVPIVITGSFGPWTSFLLHLSLCCQ